MNMRYLIVDGMLSGTGIRDGVEGGYIRPTELGLSMDLAKNIADWVSAYENAHFAEFADLGEVAKLDAQGMALCKRLMGELPDSKIEYYSSAKLQKFRMD